MKNQASSIARFSMSLCVSMLLATASAIAGINLDANYGESGVASARFDPQSSVRTRAVAATPAGGLAVFALDESFGSFLPTLTVLKADGSIHAQYGGRAGSPILGRSLLFDETRLAAVFADATGYTIVAQAYDSAKSLNLPTCQRLRLDGSTVVERALTDALSDFNQASAFSVSDGILLVGESTMKVLPDCSLDTRYGNNGRAAFTGTALAPPGYVFETKISVSPNGEINRLDQVVGGDGRTRIIAAKLLGNGTSAVTAVYANTIEMPNGEQVRLSTINASRGDGTVWIRAGSNTRPCLIAIAKPNADNGIPQVIECPDVRNTQLTFAVDRHADTMTLMHPQFQSPQTVVYRVARGSQQWQTLTLPTITGRYSDTLMAAVTLADGRAVAVIDTARSAILRSTTTLSAFQPRVISLDGTRAQLAAITPIQATLPLRFQALAVTASGKLYGSTLYGRGGAPTNVHAAFDRRGQRVANFGEAGVLERGTGLVCHDDVDTFADDVNGLTAVRRGFGGSFCNVPSMDRWRVDPNGVRSTVQPISGAVGDAFAPASFTRLADGRLVAAPLVQVGSETRLQFHSFDLDRVSTFGNWTVPLPADNKNYINNSVELRTRVAAMRTGGFWVAISGGSHVIVQRFDANGNAVGQQPSLLLPEEARVRDVREGADGALIMAMTTVTRDSKGDVATTAIDALAMAANGSVQRRNVLTQAREAAMLSDDTVVAIGVSGGTNASNGFVFARSKWRSGAFGAPTTDLASSPIKQPRLSIYAVTVAPDGALLVAFDAIPEMPLGSSDFEAGVARFTITDDAPVSIGAIGFYNTALKHYFVTADSAEASGIDRGAAGAGWQRTNDNFNVWASASLAPQNAKPVCRFYGTPGLGPNSHFYTANAAECEAVKRDRGWTYEGIAFFVLEPNNGVCAAGSQPVYRFYNNGFARNDSNHRYTTNPAVMPAPWALEGVAFCAAS